MITIRSRPANAKIARRANPVPTSPSKLSALLADILLLFPVPPVLILDGLADCVPLKLRVFFLFFFLNFF